MAAFDIVIHGGKVIDGTGNPWFYGDVGIKNGKIASIGKVAPQAGVRAISAKDHVVTPACRRCK
jgi:N-acyl-D-amino-acid deacylase